MDLGGIDVQKDCDCLWLSDKGTHRVFRVRDASTQPVVDIILGQKDADGTQCNQGRGENSPSRDSLCSPGALSFDPTGNLFISDHNLEANGNRRLLEFDASTLVNDSGSAVFGIPASRTLTNNGNFSAAHCGPRERDPICGSWEVAFDSFGRAVIGLNGYLGSKFPLVFQNILENPRPVAVLGDYFSDPLSLRFDSQNNLYILDINRSRILIYHGPTTAPTPEPTFEPTLTPTSKPTLKPTLVPTAEPTLEPTLAPTAEPTLEPTLTPTSKPTLKPTLVPTTEPTLEPTLIPTAKPSPEPTLVPTAKPTPESTLVPTAEPTPEPTLVPTAEPTPETTLVPTAEPTPEPTLVPTTEPTPEPTSEPTLAPTRTPDSAFISGTITTVRGRYLQGVDVYIGNESIHVKTDELGSFVFNDLQPGTYKIIPVRDRTVFSPRYTWVTIPPSFDNINFVATEKRFNYDLYLPGILKSSKAGR